MRGGNEGAEGMSQAQGGPFLGDAKRGRAMRCCVRNEGGNRCQRAVGEWETERRFLFGFGGVQHRKFQGGSSVDAGMKKGAG